MRSIVLILIAACVLVGCGRINPSTPKERLQQAIAELTNAKTEVDRFYALPEAAKLSFEARNLAAARQYANELLSLAPSYRSDWNYGNAIHDGNMVLGRVALAEGQVAGAKDYLLKAGATPGSPQLNTFGPNMSLARDLIDRGQRDVVIEYFRECKHFWKMHDGRLDQWESQVRAGSTPEFHANLFY